MASEEGNGGRQHSRGGMSTISAGEVQHDASEHEASHGAKSEVVSIVTLC